MVAGKGKQQPRPKERGTHQGRQLVAVGRRCEHDCHRGDEDQKQGILQRSIDQGAHDRRSRDLRHDRMAEQLCSPQRRPEVESGMVLLPEETAREQPGDRDHHTVKNSSYDQKAVPVQPVVHSAVGVRGTEPHDQDQDQAQAQVQRRHRVPVRPLRFLGRGQTAPNEDQSHTANQPERHTERPTPSPGRTGQEKEHRQQGQEQRDDGVTIHPEPRPQQAAVVAVEYEVHPAPVPVDHAGRLLEKFGNGAIASRTGVPQVVGVF